MEAWIELSPAERRIAWDRFDSQFAFTSSVHEKDWPTILEPQPSLTFDISAIYSAGKEQYTALEANLNATIWQALRRCVPPAGKLYALDWQHRCYWLRPHLPFPTDDPEAWSVPVLPNGDYYIFLSEDFSFGLFGHPWEQTICAFGQQFLTAIALDTPMLFATIVRRNGHPISV